MKKWLVVIMAFWLASCSSGRENKSYYQLPIAQSGVQSTTSQGNRLLWVEQVSVPDYLAGNGVVYQTSDVQYVIANNNLWPARWISNCVTLWWQILAPGFLAGSSLLSHWEQPRIR
ncbi:lipoprotein [Salmonella enterica subsp. arizonae]|nr:lipoprotein [Salmonella enterica subsp. arizonae]